MRSIEFSKVVATVKPTYELGHCDYWEIKAGRWMYGIEHDKKTGAYTTYKALKHCLERITEADNQDRSKGVKFTSKGIYHRRVRG